MSFWSATDKEGYWESLLKRPSEDAFPCPSCKAEHMMKRRKGTDDPFECANCGGQLVFSRRGPTT